MDVEDFLQEYQPHFTKVAETGRIKCELNGHEFAPKVDVLMAFVRSGHWMQGCKIYSFEEYLWVYVS